MDPRCISVIFLSSSIKFLKELSNFSPEEEGGIIIMNPPYGHRLNKEEELQPLYKLIGDVLKKQCANMDAYIFTGNQNLSKLIGLKAKRRYMLKNGKIDCRLIVSGSHLDKKFGKIKSKTPNSKIMDNI